jgi:hypothetical protein
LHIKHAKCEHAKIKKEKNLPLKPTDWWKTLNKHFISLIIWLINQLDAISINDLIKDSDWKKNETIEWNNWMKQLNEAIEWNNWMKHWMKQLNEAIDEAIEWRIEKKKKRKKK